MISVWQIVAFLTTITSSLAAIQDNIPEHEIVSAQAPLEAIISNLSRLNDIQLAMLRDELYKKYPINAFGAKLKTAFTPLEDIQVLGYMNYRPRNASVKEMFGKKTIRIVTHPDLKSEKPDYLGWYEEHPFTHQSTEFAKYLPPVNTHYLAIQANNDGSLVAASHGYDSLAHEWGDQIDIIDAHNPKNTKKLATIFIPAPGDTLNIQFADNTTLLTKTNNKLYAWDLRGVLMERAAIDKAAQVIQNKECSTKELACALLSLEQSTQRMKNHYQKEQPETSSDNSDQVQNTDKVAKITPAKRDRSASLARLRLRLIITAGLLLTMFPQPVG